MPSVERAGRGQCDFCHKLFRNEGYQISLSRTGSWNRVFHYKYHIKCYGKQTLFRRPQCLHWVISNSELAEVDSVTRQDMLNMYPLVVWPLERRAVLKLPKPMEKLTVKELKLELMKRDVDRPSNKRKKQDLVDLLNEYFGFCSVKEIRSRYVALGYCRRMEGQKYKMNIPEYLKQIVFNYYVIRRDSTACDCEECFWA